MPPNNNQQNPQSPPQQQVPAGAAPPQPTPQAYYPPPLQPQQIQSANPPQTEYDSSRYDFFLNNNQPAAKPGLLPRRGALSGFAKILIAAGVLFLILGIIAVVLSSTRKSASPVLGLSAAISTQHEIGRVSDLGATNLTATTLKNYAITAKLTTASAQTELIDVYKKQGGSIDTKVLEKSADAKNTKALEAAAAAGTYDAAFRAIMERLISDYKTELQQASKSVTSPSGRTILVQQFEAAKLLETMLATQ